MLLLIIVGSSCPCSLFRICEPWFLGLLISKKLIQLDSLLDKRNRNLLSIDQIADYKVKVLFWQAYSQSWLWLYIAMWLWFHHFVDSTNLRLPRQDEIFYIDQPGIDHYA